MDQIIPLVSATQRYLNDGFEKKKRSKDIEEGKNNMAQMDPMSACCGR